MEDYRKHIFGEAVKGLTSGVVGPVVGALIGILLTLGAQQWVTSDLEYGQRSINNYFSFSTPLGQQGLTMAYEGKSLKNVSVVEFGIVNRTRRQFGDVDLLFSVNDPKDQTKLVSSGIITPSGLPHTEIVEELSNKDIKDSRTKKFRLKVIPKQLEVIPKQTEYFSAIFVFEGETAPLMSVVSLSKDVSIGAYQFWKDIIRILGPIFIVSAIIGLILRYFFEPMLHRKSVERFVQHAAELRKKGELKSADEQAIDDARTIFASFTHSKLSKLFGR